MGQHIDNRIQPRRKVKEHDVGARRNKASFKQYLRQIEEELLDEELEDIVDDEEGTDNANHS